MTGLPDDGLPVEERSAVRVVVLDADDRILLFHATDVERPEFGMWWELPGGGIDEGETYREAAVRELAEETGIRVTPDRVSAPTWRRDSTFLYRLARRLQHEVVVTVRLPGPGPDVDAGGQLDYEREDYPGSRWWPVAEVCDSTERFYPGRLPDYLRQHLAGRAIDEPFEVWS